MSRSAPFFRPGGTMDPNAPSYIERRADTDLLSALLAGDYVFVLDSRQKGKSSLVARTIVKLKEKGVATVKLDLQRLGANLTAEQWYGGLLAAVGQELGSQPELLEYWRSHSEVGPLSRWLGALESVVLRTVSSPIVIFVDEVDYVRALPFPADEFFAGIRDCYNRRSEAGGFERLTFCLVGVATPGQLIRNPEITPFNIGTRIDLTDFTLEETSGYAVVLGENGRNGPAMVQRVHHWVSGHPYLTQLLCSQIASDESIVSRHGVDRLVRELFFTAEARQKVANFADVERRMLDPDVPGVAPDEKRSQVLDLYGRLLRGRGVPATEENPVVASLRLSGLGFEDHGVLRVRNEAYRRVFDERWRRQSMPEGELRRQRGAARIAVLRTASVAGVLVLAVTSGAIGIWRISGERQEAITKLGDKTRALARTASERAAALTTVEKRSAELSRVSNERQQALIALNRQTESLKRLSGERAKALKGLRASTLDLQLQNYVGVMSSIRLAMEEQRWLRVAQLVDEAKSSRFRGWEWGHVAMLIGTPTGKTQLGPMRNEFEIDENGKLCVLSPDGIFDVVPGGLRLRRKLAGRTIYPSMREGNVRSGIDAATGRYVFRDTATDAILGELSVSGMVIGIEPKSRTAIVLDRNRGGIERRSFDGKTLYPKPGWGSSLFFAKYLPDGSSFSVEDQTALRRRSRTGEVLAEAQVPRASGIGEPRIRLSQDGGRLVYLDSSAGCMEIRRANDLKLISKLSGASVKGYTTSFSPDTKWLAVVGEDSILRVHDVATGQVVWTVRNFKDPLFRVAFLDDGRHIATLERSGVCQVWPVEPEPAYQEIDHRADPSRATWFSDDGKYLISLTASGAFETMNVRTGKVARKFEPGFDLWSPATDFGSRVFVGGPEGRVERLSMDTLKGTSSEVVFERGVGWTSMFEGGESLLAGSAPIKGRPITQFAVLEAKTLKVRNRFEIPLPKSAVWEIPIWSDPESKLIVLGYNVLGDTNRFASNATGRIFVVDAREGRTVLTLAMKDSVVGVVPSPDDKQLVVATYPLMGPSSQIQVFDPRSGRKIGEFPAPYGDAIERLIPLDEGRVLAAKTVTGKIHLYDMTTRSQIGVLADATLWATVQFASGRLVTMLGDRITVWGNGSWEELFSLRYESAAGALPPTSSREYPAISRDGRRIVLACKDGFIRMWNSLPTVSHPKAARK